MATGTEGIATRENINSLKPGTYDSDLKRCVTYDSLTEAGFSVNDMNLPKYLSNTNRLVRYSDINQSVVLTFRFVIDVSSDLEIYDYDPITLKTGENMKLTKNDSSINLLDSSTYGPSDVYTEGNKQLVIYTLRTKTYSVSDITPCIYKLSYSGCKLINAYNRISTGSLYASSTSENQYDMILVNTNSSAVYTFLGYLRLPTITPPTPTNTYKFRLRFRFDTEPSYQIKVNFICTIYSSTGMVLRNCSVSDRTFTVSEMPFDIITSEVPGTSYSYYYIDLWTGDTAPQYVTISSHVFKYNSSSAVNNWTTALNTVENTRYTGTSPSLTGGGVAYTTLNPYDNNYSVDCLVNI